MDASHTPSQAGRRYRRRLPVLAIVGVLTLTGMTPATDTTSPPSETDATVAAFEPRAGGYIGWTVMRGMITSGYFKGLVGKHTVVVVPMEVKGGNTIVPPRMRTRVLAQVRDFWSRSVPGLSFRFIVKKSVAVPRSYCTDAGAAWSLAARRASDFDPYKKFNHLAAIVDCGNLAGLGDLRAGSGRVWAGAWVPAAIAHELGHNLGFVHSNGMYCKEGKWLVPEGCTQLEYADPFDIMGNVPWLDGLTLHGLWRALIVGSQSIPKALPAHITLERPGAERAARPLVLKSSLGPLFIDHAAFNTEGEACSVPGVQFRLATQDGKDQSAGQALIGVKGSGGEVMSTPGPLDPFTIPGTKYRAYISSHGDDTVALRVIPLSDKRPPAEPVYQDLPSSPVPLLLPEDEDLWWEPSRTLTVTLPRAKGVIGYVVKGVDDCSSVVLPGGSFQVTLDDRAELKITPVGANGVTGKVQRLQLLGQTLQMTFVDPYPEPGDIIRWEIAADQSDRLLNDLQQFTISYRPPAPDGCDYDWKCRPDGTVIATLPASARAWDPVDAVRQYGRDNGCVKLTLTARSPDGPLWRDSIYACRP